MTIEITMPRLSDTMEKGTIIKWHVSEGDEISAGEVLADVETDKATMEMQSFDDGVVAKIAVDEGVAVDIGTVVAVIAEEGESADENPGYTMLGRLFAVGYMRGLIEAATTRTN